MFGIKSANVDIKGAQVQNKTLDSTFRTPMIELTSTPKRFATVPYTFTSEPAVGANTTLLTLPHGYDYAPANTVYASTNYEGRSLSDFFALELYRTDVVSGDNIFIFNYTDNTNLYIKARREIGGVLTNLNGSQWLFTYRIYALTG